MFWLLFTLGPVLDGMAWLEVTEDALAFLHPWPNPGWDGMSEGD